MAMSNHERIGKGLEALKVGLGPYVVREMRAEYGGRWLERVGRDLDPAQLTRFRRDGATDAVFVETADVDALLKLMRVYYRDVFQAKLGHDARSYVGELTGVRHNWAHQQPFSLDEASRALDTMVRLLRAVSAGEEAEEVLKHHRAVQRGLFEADQRRETRQTVSEIPSTGGLRPWRDVVTPHPDVMSGRYQEAEFAADLAEVLRGTAEPEYGDPVEFFRRTYLTEGMVALLANVMSRIGGAGGDPVIQLQTVFGGGKTHSMLALYHLLGGRIGLPDVPDGEKVLAAAEVDFLPRASRAVLVGTDLDPTVPRQHPDGVSTRTLWGEMAYQLGGKEAHALVAEADERGVAPGASTLKRLFDEYGPALVLADEMVAYMRNIYRQEGLAAGSFDSNITFVQNLTEAAKRSEGSVVVVSVPVSERVDEAGRSGLEVGGEVGVMVAGRLEQVIGRLESVWKPVGAAEGFEIVRRRLFSGEVNAPARDAVVSAFARMYRENRSEYPSECAEGEYERRLRSAYPIHPELFDRLYQDWSTLEKFQRTRGVLRLMAAVIHELWARGDGAHLILPGTLPLNAPKVRNQFLKYLPEGWDAVVDTDVDGPDSRPEALDGEFSGLGRLAAARRVARAVFVGSAPSVTGMRTRGIEEVRVRLGSVQPGEGTGVFGDALRRLSGSLTYLYSDGSRYWYDTRPNVNREAADRAQQVKPEEAEEEIVARLKGERSRGVGQFAGVHVAPLSTSDVPDEPEARLVVLGPSAAHRRGQEDSAAIRAAAEVLDNRGSSPRRYRNALVFLAPDRSGAEALEDAARQVLAWRSIWEERDRLNLDTFGRNQARANLDRADETLDGRLRESYRWLLYPQQDGTGPLEWVPVPLPLSDAPLVARASRKLESEDALVPRWSPVHLKNELDRYLWRGGDHTNLRQLRDDLATYPYLTRLKDAEVLRKTVEDGARGGEYFGYATSVSEDGRYEGLQFGGLNTAVYVDASSVVVRPEVARRQQEEDACREAERKRDAYGIESGGGGGEELGEGNGLGPVVEPETASPPRTLAPRRFRAEVKVPAETLSGSALDISEAVVEHLASIVGSEVEITLRIETSFPDGAPENVVRTVGENCRTLKFESFRFE
jgi:predicted AAA+ superfamily ATPase